MLKCIYRSTCAYIKLRKLRSTCSADTKARAQIESSESGPLSMKSMLLKFSIVYEEPVAEGFKMLSMVLKLSRDPSMA